MSQRPETAPSPILIDSDTETNITSDESQEDEEFSERMPPENEIEVTYKGTSFRTLEDVESYSRRVILGNDVKTMLCYAVSNDRASGPKVFPAIGYIAYNHRLYRDTDDAKTIVNMDQRLTPPQKAAFIRELDASPVSEISSSPPPSSSWSKKELPMVVFDEFGNALAVFQQRLYSPDTLKNEGVMSHVPRDMADLMYNLLVDPRKTTGGSVRRCYYGYYVFRDIICTSLPELKQVVENHAAPYMEVDKTTKMLLVEHGKEEARENRVPCLYRDYRGNKLVVYKGHVFSSIHEAGESTILATVDAEKIVKMLDGDDEMPQLFADHTVLFRGRVFESDELDDLEESILLHLDAQYTVSLEDGLSQLPYTTVQELKRHGGPLRVPLDHPALLKFEQISRELKAARRQ